MTTENHATAISLENGEPAKSSAEVKQSSKFSKNGSCPRFQPQLLPTTLNSHTEPLPWGLASPANALPSTWDFLSLSTKYSPNRLKPPRLQCTLPIAIPPTLISPSSTCRLEAPLCSQHRLVGIQSTLIESKMCTAYSSIHLRCASTVAGSGNTMVKGITARTSSSP